MLDDWEPEEPRRAGLRRVLPHRLSMPVTAAVCASILVIAGGLALGRRAGHTGTQDPGPRTAAAASDGAPPIDFIPITEDSPTVTASDPSPSAGAPSPVDGSPLPTASGSTPPVRPQSSAPPSTTASPARPVTFAGVGGYHCTSPSTIGFRHVGWYSLDKEGWYTTAQGGWASDGCIAHFESMPMSGDATKDDPGIYAEWWFTVGSTSSSCDTYTYTPATTDDKRVAGHPATFQVRDAAGGTVRATFTVDQTINRGAWRYVGTYAVHGTQIAFRVLNRGVDWAGSTKTYAHVAVAQVKVVCH